MYLILQEGGGGHLLNIARGGGWGRVFFQKKFGVKKTSQKDRASIEKSAEYTNTDLYWEDPPPPRACGHSNKIC